MTHALKGARRPRQSGRALFEDAHFSDIWNDAQNSRTAVVRAHVQSLIRRIRRAMINRALAQADIAPGTARKRGVPDVG
jgi:hypothetical protein